MRRLKYRTPEEVAAAEAEAAIEQFAGVGKKRKTRTLDPERAREELRGYLVKGDFTGATPKHLAALYEWCHEQVYGVRPSEMATRVIWTRVVFAAAKMLKDDFAGDMGATIAFIRWTWQRERERERARRAGRDNSNFRIGWRIQFVTKHLVTDYRIANARQGTL
jgi:hypothetical protein